LAHIVSLPGLDAWEAATEDARARLAGARAPADDRIVIVGLDDRTHREMPDLFQTRRGVARLLDAVAAQRPAVVGLDMFFASPEERLDPAVVAKVDQALAALAAEAAPSPAAQAAGGALAAVKDELRGDELLAAAVARAAHLHLAFLLHLDEEAPRRRIAPPAGIARARLGEAVITDQPTGRRPARAAAVTASLPAIGGGAAGAGFVNITPDPDGGLRRVPLVIEYGGACYAAFGLAIALAASGSGADDVTYVTGDDFVELGGGERIPIDRRGRASLSYLGPARTFPHVSAADVVSGAAAGALTGKIALIGYTDAARDTIVQPFDSVTTGIEGHATLVHNILHGELLRRAGPLAELLLVAALGAVIALLQLRRVRQRGAWAVGVGALVAVVACFAASQYLFTARATLVPVVPPVVAAIVAAAAALSTALATEGREKARLRSAFSRYVPPGVVERIIADPSRVRLGGERRELTVLFSDIRGFSRSAENLEPEVLSEYLNEFLTPMTSLVLDDGGMLDKYIGDAIMAVYGAPLEAADHASRACRTALAMQAALASLNAGFARRGLPGVALGIGINSGPMSVGNMGSQARFDYTVLGDAVNLGARLEALTRDYRVDVLVGEQTAELARGEFAFRELDTVRVKGRAGVGRIHELCGPVGAVRFTADDLALFGGALADYRGARWPAAGEALRAFLARHPDDGPAAVLLERVEALRARPQTGEWDGVFDQLVK
ncbi:MAG TPA: adenylate/guanylate cyclase domain-containing protein, partial [Kofleriaceae bacterium]|nr:adenylate/guanylate cyclase domain-containing protein [Kofleriaceae bacterium]